MTPQSSQQKFINSYIELSITRYSIPRYRVIEPYEKLVFFGYLDDMGLQSTDALICVLQLNIFLHDNNLILSSLSSYGEVGIVYRRIESPHIIPIYALLRSSCHASFVLPVNLVYFFNFWKIDREIVNTLEYIFAKLLVPWKDLWHFFVFQVVPELTMPPVYTLNLWNGAQ